MSKRGAAARARRSLAAAGMLVGAAMAWGPAPSAHAAYIDTVTSQTPAFYWRLNESAAGSLASVVDHSDTANSAASTALAAANVGQSSGVALTPAGGFSGFESGNTWFNFPAAAAGDFVASLTSPLGAASSTLGSVSNWIRTSTGTTATYGTLYRVDAGATGALYTFIDSAGKFGIRISNGSNEATMLSDVRSLNAYDDGEWHHVAAAWDEAAGGVSLYIDGGLAAGGETVTGAFADGIDFASTGRHQFGKGTNNASEFQGAADELAIWSRALGADEVRAQFQAAIPEPTGLALSGLAAGACLLRRRRPHHAQSRP